MMWGLEVTGTLHEAAHVVRKRVREGVELGMAHDGIEDVVRSCLLEAVLTILKLPPPCAERYEEVAGIGRRCERERGHRGPHEGNL